ncbi:MAG: hypothetical protein HAW66_01675 [Shewanella sp.]|nr:hypothetical protein [Shewanella sp.]
MIKTTLKIASIVAVLTSTSSFAADCGVHSSMQLSSKSGTWHTQVQHLNQIGDVVLLGPDQKCKPINSEVPNTEESVLTQQVISMNVSPDSMLTVGHVLGDNETFDTSLLLSMVQVPEEGQAHDSPTKTCMFYVAAIKKAKPLTRVFELNGARCSFDNDETNMIYSFGAE